MLDIIIDFFKGIVERAALMFGAFRYGAMREKKKETERERDEAISQAKDASKAAGATAGDAARILRFRADRKRKDRD